MPFATFSWENMPLLAEAGTKIWILTTQWAEKDFVLYVQGASSVRNKQDEKLFKIFVFTIGRNFQFLNCHKFVMF